MKEIYLIHPESFQASIKQSSRNWEETKTEPLPASTKIDSNTTMEKSTTVKQSNSLNLLLNLSVLFPSLAFLGKKMFYLWLEELTPEGHVSPSWSFRGQSKFKMNLVCFKLPECYLSPWISIRFPQSVAVPGLSRKEQALLLGLGMVYFHSVLPFTIKDSLQM